MTLEKYTNPNKKVSQTHEVKLITDVDEYTKYLTNKREEFEKSRDKQKVRMFDEMGMEILE